MALTESDLSDLLAALKAGEMTDPIRTSLEWILQQLIEAKPRRSSARARMSGPRPAPRNATDTAIYNDLVGVRGWTPHEYEHWLAHQLRFALLGVDLPGRR